MGRLREAFTASAAVWPFRRFVQTLRCMSLHHHIFSDRGLHA